MVKKLQGLSCISFSESVQISRSSSGQQDVMSTEAVLSEIKMDGEEYDEKESLCSFGISISVHIIYASLDHRAPCGSNDIVEGIIMKLAHVDTLVVAVLMYLEPTEQRAGHRQNVYAHTFKIT